MTLIEMVQARIRELDEARTTAQTRLDAITAGVEARGDSNLTVEETAEMDEILATIRTAATDREAAEARLSQLEAAAEQRTIVATAATRIEGTQPAVQINSDNERVYTRSAERHGVSFLRDLISRQDDPQANERILTHMREDHRSGLELRDVGTGAFAGLTVPQYLTDLVGPARRAGRPVANIANGHELPASGMTVNISRITTGSAAAAQTAENAAVQETDMDDTLLTVNVRTIAGAQDVSRQAIDRGTGIDSVIVADLVSAYNTNLDSQIINNDGTSGTHLGIRSTGSIISVTYTDASPTAAELYPKLADLVQQIQAGVYMGISHFVMHPRRWWWIAKELGSTFPLLQFPGSPDRAGNAGGTGYEDTGRSIFGVPVVVDGNMLTNLGAGTEDVILGVTASELHLWEDPSAPLLIRAEQTGAGNLTVKLVVYGYSAFTAGRYPGAHGLITGTGLAAPTF